jgi:mRNA-degrading endonuclease toxin of MazEF toxin-antitoxin module
MATAPPVLPRPSQGEIWVVKLHTEPEDKGPRYVIVVSVDAQNHHPRAATVLVVPISTSLSGRGWAQFAPGETGLAEISEIWPNAITVVRKEDLKPPKTPLRKLGRTSIRRIAADVVRAMGILPNEIAE